MHDMIHEKKLNIAYYYFAVILMFVNNAVVHEIFKIERD